MKTGMQVASNEQVPVKQYPAKPEQGTGKGWEGGQGKRRGLMGLLGSGGLEKGK